MTPPRSRRSLRMACTLLFGLCSATAGAAPVFTGNVAADFSGPGVQTFTDLLSGDVPMPVAFAPGTVSGWDIADVRLFHDAVSDTLFVGINTVGIAGDADGDGDPGGTTATLAGLGGSDIADLGGTESIALMLDIDEDGVIDVIAGVSASTDTSGFSVNAFSGSAFSPSLAFGAALPGHTGTLFASPSAAAPDFEFTITSFSALPFSSTSDTALTFGLTAFAGSFSDAGISEDFLPGVSTMVQATASPVVGQSVPEPGVLSLLAGACLLVRGARRSR